MSKGMISSFSAMVITLYTEKRRESMPLLLYVFDYFMFNIDTLTCIVSPARMGALNFIFSIPSRAMMDLS